MSLGIDKQEDAGNDNNTRQCRSGPRVKMKTSTSNVTSQYMNIEFNSLRPSDAHMRQQTNQHWFRQWLVAWPAPSHYLNQCWNIVNLTLRNKLQWKFNRYSYIFNQKNAFENVVWKMAAILSRPQCVKVLTIWPAFFRQQFHYHYLDNIVSLWIQIPPAFLPEGPTDNQSVWFR